MNRKRLENSINSFMESEMNRLFQQVPSAFHLIGDERSLNENYYLRHRVETIKRIWMTARTDALALAKMVDEDYEAARWWSKYIYQELNHDLLFIKDLEKHGYNIFQIASVPPFASTVAMVNYIENIIPRMGSIAAVAYSVWVEWNSDRTSAKVVERATKQFSPKHVKGAKAHVHIDINEDHYSVILDIVHSLTQRKGDSWHFFEVLYRITDFVSWYFKELEAETPDFDNYVLTSYLYAKTKETIS